MNRPLLITDCDEVLMHMVVPFRQWLDEAHDIHFSFEDREFTRALRRKECGTILEKDEVWTLLRNFFQTEMHRQSPIEGALPALERLSAMADIVVLTNISEEDHGRRTDQLRAVGLPFPVLWNQGGKGRAVRRLIEEYRPAAALFVDDLGAHHQSLTRHAPEVWRLHMVGERELAPFIDASPDAHARIDRWQEAEQWISAHLEAGPAPVPAAAPADKAQPDA
ncbi:MAG: HAD family hydrolase [Sphingobium sp.]